MAVTTTKEELIHTETEESFSSVMQKLNSEEARQDDEMRHLGEREREPEQN